MSAIYWNSRCGSDGWDLEQSFFISNHHVKEQRQVPDPLCLLSPSIPHRSQSWVLGLGLLCNICLKLALLGLLINIPLLLAVVELWAIWSVWTDAETHARKMYQCTYFKMLAPNFISSQISCDKWITNSTSCSIIHRIHLAHLKLVGIKG